MLINQKKTGMMERMKRQFLKMKSPFGFGGTSGRLDSPAYLNIPPEMARRDAAFQRAAAILYSDMFVLSDEDRRKHYLLAGLLLEFCIEKTQVILGASANLHGQFGGKETLQFLRFLHLTVENLAGLASCQEEMDLSTDKMSDLLGTKALYAFRSFDEHFSESEISLYNFLVSLLRQSEDSLKNYRTACCRNFSKSECERYDKAFAYYTEFYAKLDPAKEESFEMI